MAELVAARSWLTVYRLPPYASNSTRSKRSGRTLKISLANLTRQNTGQLTAPVKTGPRRMQYRAGLLDGFPAKTGLDLNNLRN